VKPLTRRRFRSLTLAVLALAAIAYWLRWIDLELGRPAFASGYLLYGLVVFLALLNLRKKLPTLPLGHASAWLQLHIYVGLVAGGVFGLHLAWRVPNGWFESLLAVAFMTTFVSGVVGLVISRRTPRLLNRVSQQVVYERVAQLRRTLAERSRSMVVESVTASGATTLADFYTHRLFDFFARPRPFGYFFRPASTRRKKLLGELRQLERYLSPPEKSACEPLYAMIRKKDDIDFQEVRQRLLKVWLFGHIGLTYVLVVLATVHGVMALAHRGDVG
jgi:hypothetical protein